MQEIKELCKKLSVLELLKDHDKIFMTTDASDLYWAGVLQFQAKLSNEDFDKQLKVADMICDVRTITDMTSSSSYNDADLNILEMKRELALLDLELAEKAKTLQQAQQSQKDKSDIGKVSGPSTSLEKIPQTETDLAQGKVKATLVQTVASKEPSNPLMVKQDLDLLELKSQKPIEPKPIKFWKPSTQKPITKDQHRILSNIFSTDYYGPSDAEAFANKSDINVENQKCEHNIGVVSAPPLFENKIWSNIEEFKLLNPTKHSSLHVLLKIEGDLSPYYEGRIDLPRDDNVKARAIGLQKVKRAANDYEFWSFFRDERDVLVKILDGLVKSSFTFWLKQEGARSQMQECAEGQVLSIVMMKIGLSMSQEKPFTAQVTTTSLLTSLKICESSTKVVTAVITWVVDGFSCDIDGPVFVITIPDGSYLDIIISWQINSSFIIRREVSFDFEKNMWT
ncbi:hypothetical protein ACLOJK_018541 [Asimina triloba]